jgi:hypothetical protein
MSKLQRHIRRVLTYVALGGVACWFPDVVLRAIRGYAFSNKDLSILTVLLPLASITGLGIVMYLMRPRDDGPSVALFMLFGVWFFGPLLMVIGGTFGGGGLAKPPVWSRNSRGDRALAVLRGRRNLAFFNQ